MAKGSRKKVVGKEQIRRLLGIDRKKMNELVEAGLPQEDNGKFDKDKCVQWLSEYIHRDDPVPDTIIYDRKSFANKMGVTAAAVSYWETHAERLGFPGAKNYYPLQACIDWREAQKEEPSNAGAPAKKREPDRLSELRADKLETEIRVKKGELVPMDEVADYLRRSVARHREILRAFPDRLAKKIGERSSDSQLVSLCRREAVDMIEDLQKQIHQDLIEHAEEDVATE